MVSAIYGVVLPIFMLPDTMFHHHCIQYKDFGIVLQSQGINFLVFTGIDTSICVETSLREGFNTGYDVAIISDATASGDKRHYETTLERVRDYYGLVMNSENFKKMIRKLDKMRKGEAKPLLESEERVEAFLEEFNLLDPRQFPAEQVNL
jgi:ureidoacrylate peracid hydrolase